MALKRKIDKAAFDKLSKDIQGEYAENDGVYTLDVDGAEDTGALKRAKDRAVQDVKDAKKRADLAEEKLAALDIDKTREAGDMAKMEKIWQGKLDVLTAETKAANDARDATTSTALINSTAQAMATELATSPALLLPHITARIKADMSGDTPFATFHDANGASVGIDALKKEFVDNKDFASIIIASKAKGGGAPDHGQRKGSASHTTNDGKPVMLNTLSGKDLAAQIAASKEAET